MIKTSQFEIANGIRKIKNGGFTLPTLYVTSVMKVLSERSDNSATK